MLRRWAALRPEGIPAAEGTLRNSVGAYGWPALPDAPRADGWVGWVHSGAPQSRDSSPRPRADLGDGPRGPAGSTGSYLVDSASSHMLVSKFKPCMSKYRQLYSETANGSLNQLSFI